MIVTMAYDEDLANRIRELIASEDGYTEQKMFGGIGFMIDREVAVRNPPRPSRSRRPVHTSHSPPP